VDRHPPVSPRTAVLLEVARLARGWSYRQAAHAIGCSHEFLRLLESCQRAPSALMAREIAAAYHLDRPEADLLSAESVNRSR
jgi:transcriptional regulator with XRE-family HTH domain